METPALRVGAGSESEEAGAVGLGDAPAPGQELAAAPVSAGGIGGGGSVPRGSGGRGVGIERRSQEAYQVDDLRGAEHRVHGRRPPGQGAHHDRAQGPSGRQGGLAGPRQPGLVDDQPGNRWVLEPFLDVRQLSGDQGGATKGQGGDAVLQDPLEGGALQPKGSITTDVDVRRTGAEHSTLEGWALWQAERDPLPGSDEGSEGALEAVARDEGQTLRGEAEGLGHRSLGLVGRRGADGRRRGEIGASAPRGGAEVGVLRGPRRRGVPRLLGGRGLSIVPEPSPDQRCLIPTTFPDLLAEVKRGIREQTVAELAARLEGGEEPVLLDLREPDEHAGGLLPGGIPLPRGFLELRIEALVPDRSTAVVLYCAGGVRSALGAQALELLGYSDVVSLAGGVGAWRQAGLALEQAPGLSVAQRARYARQIVLPQVGEAGQRALLDARVLLVGAGGLGSPTALYLAAAGVGTLGLVDDDLVDTSNLQRQVLHTEASEGRLKVESGRETLAALNGDVEVVTFEERLVAANALSMFEGWDVVVDGTDNFPTRYLINDACVLLDIPNVHGSVYHFDGQVTLFHGPNGGPCYRCLYPSPPPAELAPNCAEAGVLGAICGIVGTWQAAETMKLLLGQGELLEGRILSIDALSGRVRELRTRRDPACPVCGDEPTVTELIDYEAFCASGG